MKEGDLFEIKKPLLPKGESVVLPEKTGEVEDFFEQQRQFLEWYAGDSSIEMRSSEGVKLPDGRPLETFAIDLERGVMYGHPKFFQEERGYSKDKAFFAYLHEFEHFRELRALLREREGRKIWKRHQVKIKGKQRYHILDNNFDDVKMNRSVVERVPTLRKTRGKLYAENLFPDEDMTKLPKHLQFAFALNCQQQESGKLYTVHPDVQSALDQLGNLRGKSGVPFLEYATSPRTPMSVRLHLQESIIEPIYDRFFEEDVEEKKNPNSGQDKKDNQGGEGQSSENGEQQQSAPGEQSQETEKSPSEAPPQGEPQEGDAEGETAGNPEDYFREEYDEFFRRYQHATPEEVIDEAVEKEIERQETLEKEKIDKTGERAFEAYARAQKVDANDLRTYRKFVERLEALKNPENGEALIEELREIFRQIITRRKRLMLAPQYPLSEGDVLAYPAEAFTRTQAGEAEPDVWEDTETKEKEDKLVGDFDVTLVGDVSGSMAQEGKASEQRKAMTLLMEALSEFAEDLDSLRTSLDSPLNVRTEARVFGSGAECVKPLSSELTERDRVTLYKRLGQADGDKTEDYLALEAILNQLTDEEVEKIQAGKLKKIVIPMTDGESSDASRLKRALERLREKGVIVIGVGITPAGKPALTTYAPEAQLCEKAEDLPLVLAELLKEHLRAL